MVEVKGTPDKPTGRGAVLLRLPAPIRWLREGLALLLWTFVIVQVFVWDVANHLAGRLPHFALVARFRALILLGLIAASWLILGNRRFMLFVGYIIAYPFVFAFWIVPRFALRNWAVAVAFSPAIHSILRSFRSSFVLFSLAIISAFVLCLSASTLLITACMVLLGAFLILHFVRRFRVAFSSSTVFIDASGAIRNAWDSIKTSDIVKRPQGVDPQSSEYKQKFGQSVLIVYVLTTGLYLLAERLYEVVNSRKLDLNFLGSLFYTFVLTVVIFALEYLGLEWIAPGSFSGVPNPGLLDFLGLSVSTIITADVSPLHGVSGLAQTALYLQLFGSLLIIVLLVFVILTSILERYKQDLDEMVHELSIASGKARELLEANYELTIAAAEAWLLEFNPSATRWFLKQCYGEARVREIEAQSAEQKDGADAQERRGSS